MTPRPRDLALLDTLDACRRTNFSGEVWRVAREGRDPLQPSASHGRWSNGSFDVLYTALERDGAVAEVFALLTSQPVFPSRMRWWIHRLAVETQATLQVAAIADFALFGIDPSRYRDRRYETTQALADAAFFLGYDALLVPSARWNCANLVLFSERVPASDVQLTEIESEPIDWTAWSRSRASLLV